MLIDHCPICGSSEHDLFLKTKDYFLSKENFNLVKCEQCTLVYTNPIPTPDNLSKYYESNEYLSHKPKQKNLLNYIYKNVRNINIRKKYKLVKQYQPSGKVLEIGTGTGDLLNYFKQKGWETIGVEPNEYARGLAISNYSLDLVEELKGAEIEDNSLDVVMMWHVLEHVSDLNKQMLQIKKLIKKGGSIFIAVPNLNAPDFEHYKDYWAGLDVPRHLYHFTEASLKKLFDKHSLKIESMYPMKFDAYYVSLLSEKYLGNKFPYFAALKNGFRSNLKAKGNNNYSSMIFVVSE